jgi:Predicted Permease Membrane Region
LEKGVRQVGREGEAVALLPDLEIVDYSISKPIAPTANSGGGERPAKSLADWWHTLPYRAAGFLFFRACVGLKAGSRFMDTLLSQDGPVWLVAGLCITLIPLIVVGIAARVLLKMNFVVLSGLIAGSMTDPPALAFANTFVKSDAPSISYAAVYPLTMLLRILCAQFLVLLLV